MAFKIDKNLLCEACGRPVKYSESSDKKRMAFICSNETCGNGYGFEFVPIDTLPEWVVPKGTYKNLE